MRRPRQKLPGQPPRTPGLCQISFGEAQAAAARAASQDTRLMSDLVEEAQAAAARINKGPMLGRNGFV